MALAVRGLLLCGGRASRFGSDKLLEPFAPGGGEGSHPMVSWCARHLLEGAGSALAVIPPGAARLRAALEADGCEVLESARTQRGLGASLAAAIGAARDAAGWIVALGDMPLVRVETIAAVRSRLEAGAWIVAPVLADGERGHPVGFSQALRGELESLDGDEGARAIVARHRDRLVTFAVDDPGIVIDIDTREELREAERR